MKELETTKLRLHKAVIRAITTPLQLVGGGITGGRVCASRFERPGITDCNDPTR